MNRRRVVSFLSSGIVVALGAGAAPAHADDGIDQLVVTALKRDVQLLRAPASISVLSAQKLEEFRITNARDLSDTAPSVKLQSRLGSTDIFVRGIGTVFLGGGGDASVAFHEDGVYVSRPRAQSIALFDVQRIEVLRGPQGAVNGRNASAGSINVLTNRPTDTPQGYVQIGGGNYNLREFNAAYGGQLAGDALTGRLAIVSRRRSGFGQNRLTGQDIDDRDEMGARGSLRLQLGAQSHLGVTVENYRANDASDAFHLIYPTGLANPQAPPSGTLGKPLYFLNLSRSPVLEFGERVIGRNIVADQQPFRDLHLAATTMEFETVRGSTKLKSLTSFRKERFSDATDLDASSIRGAVVTAAERDRQWSQELQLSLTGRRVSAVAGVYAFYEDLHTENHALWYFVTTPAPLDLVRQGRMITRAVAAFSAVDMQFSHNLSLSVGGRYNTETRDMKGVTQPFLPPIVPVRGEASFSRFTPSVTLKYEPGPLATYYISYTEGFKSGSFVVGTNQPVVNPEILRSTEIGAKFGAPTYNITISAFKYNITDFQLQRITSSAVLLLNVPKSTVHGMEIEGQILPWPGGQANVSLSYLHSAIGHFQMGEQISFYPATVDIKGNRLPGAPKASGRVTLSQQVANRGKQFVFGITSSFESRVYFDALNNLYLSQKAHAEVGAFIRVSRTGAKWSALIWGKNLGASAAVTYAQDVGPLFSDAVVGQYNEPRTFGVTLTRQL